MTDEELALYEQRLAEKSVGLLRTLDIFCPENLRPDPPLMKRLMVCCDVICCIGSA